jgi:hypothetical protein
MFFFVSSVVINSYNIGIVSNYFTFDNFNGILSVVRSR